MRILNFQRWKLPPSNFSMTFKDSIWKEDILNTNATTNILKLESWSFQQLKELSSKSFHFETWYFQKQVFHSWKNYNTLKKSLPHLPLTWKDYYSLCNLYKKLEKLFLHLKLQCWNFQQLEELSFTHFLKLQRWKPKKLEELSFTFFNLKLET